MAIAGSPDTAGKFPVNTAPGSGSNGMTRTEGNMMEDAMKRDISNVNERKSVVNAMETMMMIEREEERAERVLCEYRNFVMA